MTQGSGDDLHRLIHDLEIRSDAAWREAKEAGTITLLQILEEARSGYKDVEMEMRAQVSRQLKDAIVQVSPAWIS